MNRLSVYLVFSVIFGFALTANAGVPFDDFSTERIDTSKWYANPSHQTTIEVVREISGGKLALKMRSPVDPNNDIPHNQLAFANPNTINAITAAVKIDAVELSGDIIVGAADIAGFFYNEAEGSVWASFGIGYDGNTYSVHAGVISSLGDQNSDPFVMVIQPGVEYSLAIAWNGDNLFRFTINDGVTTEQHDIIGPEYTGFSTSEFKALSTAVFADLGAVSGEGAIAATFDDVTVNGTPYDDFSAPHLDPANWWGYEVVREVRNGQLQLNLANNGDTSRTREDLRLKEEMATDFFQVDVTFESGNTFGTGSKGVFHIIKDGFYSTVPPGNGEDGAIYAYVTLDQIADDTFQPNARLFSCDGAECNSADYIFWEPFPSCNVQSDVPVTISAERIGTLFRFKCGDDELSHNLTGTLYEKTLPPWNAIRTQVLSNGEAGYIKVRVDNAFVSKAFPWNIFLPPILSGAKE